MAIMEYFRVNGYNLVYGSLRLDPPMHQLVFIKLLALCSISRVPGTVCLSAGIPYPAEVLASTIGVDPPTLQAALIHHAEPGTDRIHINGWGGIEIVNWATYQSKSYLRVRRFRARKKAELNTPVTGCNAEVTNRKEKNRIENRSIVRVSHTQTTIKNALFEELWKRYPSKVGKKAAEKSFRATIKTPEDWTQINQALKTYLESERVKDGFIQNGRTWFANWQDWIVSPFSNPEPSTEKPKGTPKDFGCHR